MRVPSAGDFYRKPYSRFLIFKSSFIILLKKIGTVLLRILRNAMCRHIPVNRIERDIIPFPPCKLIKVKIDFFSANLPI